MSVVTRQLHFWHLVNDMSSNARNRLTTGWWQGFHDYTHQDRKSYLEQRGTNASTIIFWIHLNMTFFGLYTTRSVIMQQTKDFDGALALKEIGIALFLVATDTRRAAYEEDAESHTFIYKNLKPPEESIAVCVLSASQLDSRNQFLLFFCEDLLELKESSTVNLEATDTKACFSGNQFVSPIMETETTADRHAAAAASFYPVNRMFICLNSLKTMAFCILRLQDQIVLSGQHTTT